MVFCALAYGADTNIPEDASANKTARLNCIKNSFLTKKTTLNVAKAYIAVKIIDRGETKL